MSVLSWVVVTISFDALLMRKGKRQEIRLAAHIRNRQALAGGYRQDR